MNRRLRASMFMRIGRLYGVNGASGAVCWRCTKTRAHSNVLARKIWKISLRLFKLLFLDPRSRDKVMKKVFFLIWCQKTKLWKKFWFSTSARNGLHTLETLTCARWLCLRVLMFARVRRVCARCMMFARNYVRMSSKSLRVIMFVWVRRVCARCLCLHEFEEFARNYVCMSSKSVYVCMSMKSLREYEEFARNYVCASMKSLRITMFALRSMCMYDVCA